MDHYEDRKAAVRSEFSRRRRNQLILLVPVFAAMFIAIASDERQAVYGIPVATLLPTAIVLVVVAIAFSLYNWRCPACARYLGRSLNPRYCIRCGVQLRE